jgi:hypothetical protein
MDRVVVLGAVDVAQILNSKWLFASNSPVFVEWVIIINAKWAIFQLYHDESFLERVIIFQRYHGKNKLYYETARVVVLWYPHKMCERTYGQTNMKRALTLAKINHPWNRYNMHMLRSWPIQIPNMNKMRQKTND